MADIYPESRVEEILVAMINGEEYTKFPESRIEALLIELLGKIIEVEGRGAYEFKGSVDFDELPETLTEDMAGWTYNMAESFTTDNRFVDGAGKSYPQGTNVSVANVGTDEEPDMMFDVPSAFVDVTAIYNTIHTVAANLASTFSDQIAYRTGDLVVKDDVLYKFTSDHAAGEFNPLEVEQTDMDRLLAGVYNVIPTDLSDLDDDSTHRTVTDAEKSEWNGKQDTLTFDDTPTASSTNPVTSDGIQKAITATAKTASGNPIVIQDAANVSAESLKLTLAPVQSGTGDPSPTNVRPISGRTEVNLGRTGKNVLPMTVAGIKAANISGTWSGNAYTINGMTFTILTDDDGNVTGINVNGTATANTSFNVERFTGRGNYKISGVTNGSVDSYYFQIINSEGTTQLGYFTDGDYDFDVTQDILIRIRIISGASVTNKDFYPMIRDASAEDPTFEPYTAVTVTIQLGQTVYGGTLDVKTGVLTITHIIIDLGSMDWTFETWANDMYSTTIATEILKTESSIVTSALCTIFKAVSRDDIQTSTNAFCVNPSGRVIIRDPRYTDAAEFKTAVTGEKICYPLATPTTVQLTAKELEMLKGYNYITADGDMVLSYQPDNNTGDIKSWTEQKIQSASEALDASKVDNSVVGTVENGTTASRAYAVGEHFTRNKKFCTAIASIASGATLTLNTNYVEGTIADNLIKQATFSGTTSSSGNIKISDSVVNVVGITLDNDTYCCIPFISNNKTYIHIINATSTYSIPAENTAVSGTYYYI